MYRVWPFGPVGNYWPGYWLQAAWSAGQVLVFYLEDVSVFGASFAGRMMHRCRLPHWHYWNSCSLRSSASLWNFFSPAGSFRFQHPCPTLRFVIGPLFPLPPVSCIRVRGAVPRAYPSLPSRRYLLPKSSSRCPDCVSLDGLRKGELPPQGGRGVQSRAWVHQ